MSTINPTRQRALDNIRRFLKDRPEMNRLLGTEETSPEELELMLDMSIDLFNIAAPSSIGRYDVNNFPSLYLLIMGAIVCVMRSAGVVYSRNRLNYSDQGVTVTVNDKAPEYSNWIQGFLSDYFRITSDFKRKANLASIRGGIPSEYASVDFHYGT